MPQRMWKTYLLVAGILLGIDCFLGILRFYWSFFRHIFVVINFPACIGFLWLEQQPTLWWNRLFGSFVNDEVGQIISFFLMIILQAVFISTTAILIKSLIDVRK
jgi:hypothetical protein